MQTIRALTTNRLITKLRHVDIHKHWLRQEIAIGKINLDTINILADGLTKALPPPRHKELLRLLGLEMEKIDEDSILIQVKEDLHQRGVSD